MVQPKRAPQSVRFTDDELAKIDAWAKRRGMSRHAAIRTATLSVVAKND
jgi:hypothetical protein